MYFRFLVLLFLLFGSFISLVQSNEEEDEEGSCSPGRQTPMDIKEWMVEQERLRLVRRLPKSAEEKKYGTMMLLINAGDDLNNRDEFGKTSLYYLAKYGEIEFMHYFILNGAEKDARTNSDATPLMIAASEDNLNAVCYLISQEVDFYAQNNEGKTATDFAPENSLLRCLLDGAQTAFDMGGHPCNPYAQSHCRFQLQEASAVKELPDIEESDYLVKGDSGENLLLLSQDVETELSLNVMTYNIMYDNPSWKGKKSWRYRKTKIQQTLRFFDIDIAGLQEVLHNQMEDLQGLLAEYEAVGVGRDDGETGGEYNPIFFKKGKFSLINSGTFWLSEYPSKPGSVGWDADLPRVVTWAHLRPRFLSEERDILYLNTHFDHMGPDSRVASSTLLRNLVGWLLNGISEEDDTEEETKKALLSHFGSLITQAKEQVSEFDCLQSSDEEGSKKKRVVILTGDINDEKKSDAYRTLTKNDNFIDTQRASLQESIGDQWTFTGYDNKIQKIIDFIFANASPFSENFEESENLFVTKHSVLPINWGDKSLASDHAPVMASLVLTKPKNS